jgi:hypothetical protein
VSLPIRGFKPAGPILGVSVPPEFAGYLYQPTRSKVNKERRLPGPKPTRLSDINERRLDDI